MASEPRNDHTLFASMCFETHFEPYCVLPSFSGAQGGKGLVFALQESPGRYPLTTSMLSLPEQVNTVFEDVYVLLPPPIT